MSKDVSFTFAEYLGGFPNLPKRRGGPMVFEQTRIKIAGWRPSKPLVEVRADAIVSIEIGGGEVSKSRAGAALMTGVGALAAKGTEARTHISVHMRSGNVGIFRIDKTDPMTVKAKIAPWVTEHGIAWHGEQVAAPVYATGVDTTADQLGRLADLHKAGALSDDEFTAAKARLLG